MNATSTSVVVYQYPPASNPFRWRWRTRRLERDRFGALCRVVYEAPIQGVNGGMRTMITVEFEDGTRSRAYRGEVRRIPGR